MTTSLSKRPPTLLEVSEDVITFVDSLEAIDFNPDLDEAGKAKARVELAEMMKPQLEAAVKKVDSFGRSLSWMKAQIEAAKAEEKRLAARRAALESTLERLKGYGLAVLNAVPGRKLGGQTHTLAVQANGGKPALLVDEEKLPRRLFSVNVRMRLTDWEMVRDAYVDLDVDEGTPYPDNERIRKALEAKEPIAGAELVRGEHLAVR